MKHKDNEDLIRIYKEYYLTKEITMNEAKRVYALNELAKKYGIGLCFDQSYLEGMTCILKLGNGSWVTWKNDDKGNEQNVYMCDSLDHVCAYVVGINAKEILLRAKDISPLFACQSILDYYDELVNEELDENMLKEYVKQHRFSICKVFKLLKK